MSDELYHAWLKKGEAAENHKYNRRYWKNGRWNYVYPKGQNYKTVSQVNEERLAAERAESNQKTEQDKFWDTVAKADEQLTDLIRSGRDFVRKIDFALSRPVRDLFD